MSRGYAVSLRKYLPEPCGDRLSVRCDEFIKYGNVPLSSDDRQRRERELEVAQCLKERASRLHLLDEDMRHLEQAIAYYGQ